MHLRCIGFCCCVLLCVSLASTVNIRCRCLMDSGGACPHVQFCQGELIHKVRQLKETQAHSQSEEIVS